MNMASNSFTRTYNYYSDSNRLKYTQIGSNYYRLYNLVSGIPFYDEHGNITQMPHLSSMKWNALDQLSIVTSATVTAYYQYDGSGQRVSKYTDKGSGNTEQRIYLGNFEIYRKFSGTDLVFERTTVHIADDTGRIGMLEMRNTDYDTDTSPEVLKRFIYGNHLQSSSLELDEDGEIISYEEYHPYGTTSYHASSSTINAVAKRYRFTGKERDDDTGFYYHGARYYIPWLCRWASPDPINDEWYNAMHGKPERNKERSYVDLTASPYEYSYDNPIMYNDPSGEQPPANTIWDGGMNNPLNRSLGGIGKKIEDLFKSLNFIDSVAKNRLTSYAKDLFTEVDTISEEDKIEIFKTDYIKTSAILLFEFSTGFEPPNSKRVFNYSETETNSFANKFLESYVLDDLISGLYDEVKSHSYLRNVDWMDVLERESYYVVPLTFSPGQLGFKRSIQKHIIANQAQMTIGAATAFVYPTGPDSARVTIVNKMSRNSLLLHLGSNYDIPIDLGTQTQEIHFNITNLDKNKTSEYESSFWNYWKPSLHDIMEQY